MIHVALICDRAFFCGVSLIMRKRVVVSVCGVHVALNFVMGHSSLCVNHEKEGA